MSNIVIQANNISKQYRLGQVSTGTIGHDFNRWWYRIRGKEDPYLQIGETNDRTQKGSSDYVWSLRDINFDIERGDAIGIIGRNGAGKSTLLKILSKVTQPTTGTIKTKGKIASLLEVGTGFHPELSGRDNVFLNGAILGMRKTEIKRKFDEIVDFAGVERYIDTPVKRYSSGMYVRLAFAVAAYLESEILIVDEVLAVGDAEFQKKCLGKMGDVSRDEGRTILFVSHNINAVLNLCKRSILLNNGRLINFSDTQTVVNQYQAGQNKIDNIDSEFFSISQIKISKKLISTGDDFEISFFYKKVKPCPKAYLVVAILSHESGVTSANNFIDNCDVLGKNEGIVKLTFPKMNILVGHYSIVIGIKDESGKVPLITTTIIDDFEIIFDFEKSGISVPLNDISNHTTPFVKYFWSVDGKPIHNTNMDKVNEIFWQQ